MKLATGDLSVVGAPDIAARPNGNYVYAMFGLNEVARSVLRGMVKIGICTQDDVDDHLRRLRAHKAKQRKKWDKDAVLKLQERYPSLKMPKELKDG